MLQTLYADADRLDDASVDTAVQLGALGLPRISVIIPTLNEAKNLPILLPRLPQWVEEVVIVDGCSEDDTVEVAKQLRDVTIILERRRGKGAALRAGFAAARGEILVVLDADCSMHPREMVLLVSALLSGADFVKGSQFIQGGGTDDMSRLRMLGNWGLTSVVHTICTGVPFRIYATVISPSGLTTAHY